MQGFSLVTGDQRLDTGHVHQTIIDVQRAARVGLLLHLLIAQGNQGHCLGNSLTGTGHRLQDGLYRVRTGQIHRTARIGLNVIGQGRDQTLAG